MKTLFKSLLTVMAVAAFCFGVSMHASAKSKAKKPSWCCMAAGQVVMDKGKKLCVKGKEAPATTDKKHKKQVKACEVAGGAWEQEQPIDKSTKPAEPKPEAKPEEMPPPAPGGEPTEEVPLEK